ncbi:hypothetical protein [Citrobacter portucalensis]|uniref:hypothetical protein n=1 Tax=Citrobacter portucalensis TaxID=1639133 RepID=UPI00397905D0
MAKYNTGNPLLSENPRNIHHECHDQPDLITRAEEEKRLRGLMMSLSNTSKKNSSSREGRFNPEKYLSVTWQMGGRAYPVLDCYGVIHEVRRDLGLPDWPVFEGVINEGCQMNDTCNSFRSRVQKCEPEEGAVAACYTAGLVTHLGIAVNVNGALHILEANPKRNVTILPLARFLRQYVKVEFYK